MDDYCTYTDAVHFHEGDSEANASCADGTAGLRLRAFPASCPETLHCIRTVHLLGREGFMRKRYDEAIEEGYQATERTNFYDSVYSPVILIVSAAVTALVFVLSSIRKSIASSSVRHVRPVQQSL